MRLLAKLSLITALVATAASHAAAQASAFDVPEMGARIRVSVNGASANTGTVLARSNDSIVVDWTGAGRGTVAMNDLSKLEISSGQSRHVGRGALIGLGIGAAIGVLGALAFHDAGNDVRRQACAPGEALNCITGSVAGSYVSAAGTAMIPAGMLLGAGLGALFGSIETERWTESTTHQTGARVGLVPTMRTRGVALVVSGRF